jgi:hypothetical protein
MKPVTTNITENLLNSEISQKKKKSEKIVHIQKKFTFRNKKICSTRLILV